MYSAIRQIQIEELVVLTFIINGVKMSVILDNCKFIVSLIFSMYWLRWFRNRHYITGMDTIDG